METWVGDDLSYPPSISLYFRRIFSPTQPPLFSIKMKDEIWYSKYRVWTKKIKNILHFMIYYFRITNSLHFSSPKWRMRFDTPNIKYKKNKRCSLFQYSLFSYLISIIKLLFLYVFVIKLVPFKRYSQYL